MATKGTSRTKQNHKKVAYDTSASSEQLIMPPDLTNNPSYAPFVVVLSPNALVGSNYSIAGKVSTPKNRINKNDNTVDSQTSTGIGSVRQQKLAGTNGKASTIYVATGERIVLPMPNQYNITDSSTWQTTELGLMGRSMDAVNSTIAMIENDKNSPDGAAVLAQQLLGQGAMRGSAALAQKLSGALGGSLNVLDYIQLKSGISANNYSEVMFKGMINRTLPLSYTFAPRDLSEAQILRSIIHRLKYHMRPEFYFSEGNAAYIRHPSTFDIDFLQILPNGTTQPNPWVTKFSTSALTQISLNGTPNGEYAITKDGQFVAVTIDLLFTELVTHGKENTTTPDNTY